jgi:hypothetical protein
MTRRTSTATRKPAGIARNISDADLAALVGKRARLVRDIRPKSQAVPFRAGTLVTIYEAERLDMSWEPSRHGEPLVMVRIDGYDHSRGFAGFGFRGRDVQPL